MMPSGKSCSRQPKKPTKTTHYESLRAEFSLIRALISNRHIERIMGSYEKSFFLGGGGLGSGSLIARGNSSKSIYCSLFSNSKIFGTNEISKK